MSHVVPSDPVVHGAQARSGQNEVRVANPPFHPSTIHANMPKFYTLPDQRLIIRVPRPLLLSPIYESFAGITFSVYGWPGVRVRDILKDTVVIDSPDDFVFEEFGWRMTVIHLQWPGYESEAKSMTRRANVCRDGRYMTRLEFAREICGLLFNFHKGISSPIAPDFEEWTLSNNPGGIHVTDVVLLSAHYYRNIWVPEFYVIQRNNDRD